MVGDFLDDGVTISGDHDSRDGGGECTDEDVAGCGDLDADEFLANGVAVERVLDD